MVQAGGSDFEPDVWTEADEKEFQQSYEEMASHRRFSAAVPLLLVPDIAATCEFYQNMFSFAVGFSHGEPPIFACVLRDNAIINFVPGPAAPRHLLQGQPAGVADVFLVVKDLDDVRYEMDLRGVKVTSEPAEQPYGMREFQIEDCNGYRLTLAEGMLGG